MALPKGITRHGKKYRARVRRGELLFGPSRPTVADDQLYVIKSEVFNYVLNRPLQLPFEIFRVDLAGFPP